MALEFNIVEPIDARVYYHGCYESDECCKEFVSMRQIEFHVFFSLKNMQCILFNKICVALFCQEYVLLHRKMYIFQLTT